MNSVRSMHGIGDGLAALWRGLLGGRRLTRGAAWGLMIVGALAAFEIFNFSTTEFALRDVLGDLAFVGLRWSIVLAIAFCAMDFAGIARIFTPERGRDEPAEVWYLFGAWLLAAGFNATLTWWGVSVAIARQANTSTSLLMSGGTHAGRAGIRGGNGMADPRPHHRHLLDRRRPDVLNRQRSRLRAARLCALVRPHACALLPIAARLRHAAHVCLHAANGSQAFRRRGI